MKRYLKYGLIIIATLAVIGIIFYFLEKPKVMVFKKVPADVSYCFTINKQHFFENISSVEGIKNDSILNVLNEKIPKEAVTVLNTAGINPFSDLVFFGKKKKMNFAWTGNNFSALLDTINLHKWPIVKLKGFERVKINDNLYLSIDWPVMLLTNYPTAEKEEFFSKSAPKIKKQTLYHSKTNQCVVYGFVIPDSNITKLLSWIPLKGKAYVGLNFENAKTEVYYVQPEVRLTGKLGYPKKNPTTYAFISWPLTVKEINENKQLPMAISSSLSHELIKPVKYFYGEVLDTVSYTEQIVSYDMDAEFKLTQKVVYMQKTFPGLYFEFEKLIPSQDSSLIFNEMGTDMGLPIFKLFFKENAKSYIISSESGTKKNQVNSISYEIMPNYCVFANLELLKTDPFWKKYTNTNFKRMRFYANSLGKGSMYVLQLERE